MPDWKDYLNLIKHGLFGFFAFFIVLIFAKLLSMVIFNNSEFVIEVADFFLASLGFVFFILVQLVKEIKTRDDLEQN